MRPIHNWSGYQINEKGEVYSLPKKVRSRGGYRIIPGRKLTPQLKDNGYVYHHLTDADGIRRTCYLHRLLIETFLHPIPEGMEVNHKDCNKLNNLLDNLELVSHSDNIRHAKEKGRFTGINLKLTPNQIKAIAKLKQTGSSLAEVSRYLGIKPGSISNCYYKTEHYLTNYIL